jgi:citrate synthase
MSTSEADVGAPIQIHRGLKGVYFERSGVSSIDGRAGELRYRGYSIHDLAEKSTFEEVCYLLLHGELPTPPQLAALDAELKAQRMLPAEVLALIATLRRAHPMEVLRTAVSALGALESGDGDGSIYASPPAVLQQGLKLTAQVPTIVAAHHRLRAGWPVVPPDASLSQAGNFLYMLHGRAPSPEAARLMDVDLILHAEHGANASSFAARVVAGTGANLYAAMSAAVGALAGPAHGGAAEDVMRMAQEIGEPLRAAEYVRAKRANREAIMGFGHRVYRAEDPRARHLRDRAAQLSREMGQPIWYEILQAVVEAMQPYARLGVNVNVDFYAGMIYYLQNIPQDFFVPIFAMGRVPGWVTQVHEQVSNNILIRPLTEYNGPAARDYLPMVGR